MQKVIFILVFMLVSSFAFASSSEAISPQTPKKEIVAEPTEKTSEVKTEPEGELARCTISDGGFYATGNCKAVMEYYQRWKSLQQQQ